MKRKALIILVVGVVALILAFSVTSGASYPFTWTFEDRSAVDTSVGVMLTGTAELLDPSGSVIATPPLIAGALLSEGGVEVERLRIAFSFQVRGSEIDWSSFALTLSTQVSFSVLESSGAESLRALTTNLEWKNQEGSFTETVEISDNVYSSLGSYLSDGCHVIVEYLGTLKASAMDVYTNPLSTTSEFGVRITLTWSQPSLDVEIDSDSSVATGGGSSGDVTWYMATVFGANTMSAPLLVVGACCLIAFFYLKRGGGLL